ncbi:IS3 family transposase [Candidatus Babeliales bacterium]|nr:IS3 family transposase [Candidatus Babeliales bacterium]
MSNCTLKTLQFPALKNRRVEAAFNDGSITSDGGILHSDRGTQCTSMEYRDFTKKNDFILSMSAKGNCYDNAAIESFFHTLKTGHIFFERFKTRSEAIISIFEYIEVFYNRHRIHSTLNFMSPQDFEQKQLIKDKNKMESRVKSPCRRQRQNFVFVV